LSSRRVAESGDLDPVPLPADAKNLLSLADGKGN
jgi:hypothetical protein